MLENFTLAQREANGVRINFRHGGKGPPLLLLHGYPQTHVIWHKLADTLAQHFTLVMPDLAIQRNRTAQPITIIIPSVRWRKTWCR